MCRSSISRRRRPSSAGFSSGPVGSRPSSSRSPCSSSPALARSGSPFPPCRSWPPSALFRHGLILNSGEALERLATGDTVVFDKTGTLTQAQPTLANAGDIAPEDLALAGSLALSSRHPLAKAIADAAGAVSPLPAEEVPGEGVSAVCHAEPLRLGSVAWVGAEAEAAPVAARFPDASLIAFADALPQDRLRRAAGAAVRRARGGARHRIAPRGGNPVRATGSPPSLWSPRRSAIKRWRAGLKPADKIARLAELAAEGKRPLMVGDGLNDAPALAAAHVSISPISATHLAQAQADALFLGERLRPVSDALRLADKARRLMLQNLWLSALYNAIAVPLAVLGLVTPLIAALAMSGSSILVTLNALRARAAGRSAR